jgi:virginiamycin A acetyltransferase
VDRLLSKGRMRRLIKNVAYGVAFVFSAPGFCLYKITGSVDLFRGFGEFYSLFPGKFGIYVRACYYHMTLSKCPLNLNMWMFSRFAYPDSEIGDGVMIGNFCNIGFVKIEENAGIASKSSIPSGRHQHNYTDPKKPLLGVTNAPKRIYVGKNTLVGEGSIVMADVGDYCIIGAGAVVINDIEDYSVAAGNPAKIIKKRV